MTEQTQQISTAEKSMLADKAKARLIVAEILDFGVNDNQIKELIKCLALELESRDAMLKIFEYLSDVAPQESVKIYT